MEIRHIDDVLPHVRGLSGFVHVVKDGYQLIDYVYQAPDTFSHPLALECRGIKFDADGRILARPLHKFFNLGEREQPGEVDFSRPHHVTEKLDGSMIHPAMLGDEMRLMTRKGVTDVALAAEADFMRDPRYFRLMYDLLADGLTPIFEYTAPHNRIVVRYDRPVLTLLAVRDTESGAYLGRDVLVQLTREYRVPLTAARDSTGPNVHHWLAGIREVTGEEGVVIEFEDGHRLKVKTDEYVAQHRALSDMGNRKRVLALVLQGFADDVRANLDPADAEELRAFERGVFARLSTLRDDVEHVVTWASDRPRKEVALWLNGEAPVDTRRVASAVFGVLNGQEVADAVQRLALRRPELFDGVEWRGQTR